METIQLFQKTFIGDSVSKAQINVWYDLDGYPLKAVISGADLLNTTARKPNIKRRQRKEINKNFPK